ncbi:hypothetical protein BBBOND_0106110 [Babesia bigemina]|uniref:Uncharacterized protein n=1 Tax=Babesia bigemina TaxID=5866 RepID=A0A061D2L3_BABBI|nr:hypothetical protein BBBOND_0106110 [Babesia bigemina]CDR94302.1 hypothetical protein BBBOND_0106110 [Babesia bigemina]|eukprot:XP_012766488.1 hypothetical protein BBBOND_0106110 [Babesia bigemina]
MVYKSLTEAPHNLKEGIDWLMAVKGTDAEKNLKALGEAVHKFLADKPVGSMKVPTLEKIKSVSKEFLQKPRFKDLWYVKDMLDKFDGPMNKTRHMWLKRQTANYHSDYENIIQTAGITAKHMVENVNDVVDGFEKLLEKVKIPDQYKSAYTSEATWVASCGKRPQVCAVVFVGIAPMLYTGLRYVWDSARAAIRNGRNSSEEMGLKDVLKAVGYEEPGCNISISSSDIRSASNDVHPYILDKIYDIGGFWAFYGSQNVVTANDIEAGISDGVEEVMEPVEVEEPVDDVSGEEPVNAANVEEPVYSVKASEPVNAVNVEEPVHAVKASEPVNAVNVEEPLYTLRDVAELQHVEHVKPVKTRKFYMGSREVYGIPGVDIDMGLVNAWNFRKGKKPVKTLTGLGSDNIYYPGAPTVANLNAASFI